MKTLSMTLILVLVLSAAALAESKLQWSIDRDDATPYRVQKNDLTGETRVYNLKTGEWGYNLPDGKGTVQTGRRDSVMEQILRENPSQGDSGDDE